ncbi:MULTISPECIES: zincin-like metallopeptidase toxin domain-containing protein [unclassified Flavobacterium]|uniref:zincin-like metallopeptidase toxin domain-containing protein n=1 Tax=unclassified Flavobacterium TaxID=196869 RepID=UPI001F13FCC4|nr:MULTISPECIES: zincin-like metallopeptidase toxin domain-containing protein [unclassified Flavobacterium]UMY66469.1 hypothetical protein MKO97_03550 [Flavobacterium sp. HJ-32-4]
MIDTFNGIPFFRDDSEDSPLSRLLAGGVRQGRFDGLSSSLTEDKSLNEFANQSPFGEESIFAKPKLSDYFEGYVDFLPILWRIGAPMPEEDSPIPKKGMLEEVKVSSIDSTSLFDYRRYSDVNKDFQNYWTYRGTDFPGQAILNKKVGYLDREKIFLSDTGRGVTSFGLYVPYTNDNNVSLGRFSLDYLEAQSAIKIRYLDFDGLMIILQNLLGSKRKAYAEAIYTEVAKKFEPIALSESGLIFLYSAPVELLKYFSSKTLITLFLRLAADMLNGDKELIVLKVLSAMSSQREFDPDKFLELLLTKQVLGSSLFQILYDKMRDWGGENNFSKIIIQLTKIWILSSYSDPENKRYKDYQRLPSLVYTQKYILGFRNDNYSFEFKKNNDVLIIEGEGGIEIPGLNRYITQHPFQPIATVELEETENEDLKLMEGVAIPAFYLKAFDDKSVWENFEKAVWLTFDIVSLYTGIGNLAKLRYLLRTEKVAVLVLRTIFGTIQVASSTISIGLSLVENSRNRDAVNKVREYLFWLEICTLGADALSSRILAKKAGSAKEALDELRKTTKNRKALEEIDEFAEHLDEVAEAANIERGRLQGQRIDAKGIQVAREIFEKRMVELRVAPSQGAFEIEGYMNRAGKVVILEPGSAAMFITDGKKMALIIRENATVLELLHESLHYWHCKSLGKLRWYNLTKNSYSAGVVARERFVFDKLMEHRGYLNRNELIEAKDYMNSTYKRYGVTDELGNPLQVDFDFDISKIPNKRQEASIAKILNLN